MIQELEQDLEMEQVSVAQKGLVQEQEQNPEMEQVKGLKHTEMELVPEKELIQEPERYPEMELEPMAEKGLE